MAWTVLRFIGTLLLLGMPVWTVGTFVGTRRDARRISEVIGRASDPVSDHERTTALVQRRCGLRLWRELLLGIFVFDQPLIPYPWTWIVVLPMGLVVHVPWSSGDYRFRPDASRVEPTRWGFWLAWYRQDGETLRLRVYVPGHRRKVLGALRTAGWEHNAT